MFEYFRKRAERKRREAERSRSFKKVVLEMESGKGSPLEAALVVHLVEKSKESYARLIILAVQSEVITYNKGAERFHDAMLTQGSDGNPYVACFTSAERIGPTNDFGPYTQQRRIPLMELVFALGESSGIVLNPQDEHLCWTFTPEDVARMRLVIEGSFNLEIGVIYAVWMSNAYRAAKLLRRDELGVHLRIYANHWSERPTDVDVGSLSMSSDGEEAPRAFGHLPVSTNSFLSMGPKRVGRAEVVEEELEGYKIWQENNGGYFGS